MIARSESARAYTEGELLAWEEAGIESKEWLLSPDPCPICQTMADEFEGKQVPLRQPFKKIGDVVGGMEIDYADVDGPPIHPNCHCNMTAGVVL